MERCLGIIFINDPNQTRGRFRQMKIGMNAAVLLCWLFILYTGTVQSCTIVIKNHGSHFRESTKYWEQVEYTLTACEATCGSDDRCFGYFFDSADGTCMKSAYTLAKNANNCPTCSFHSKRCGSDCSLTYTIYGSDTTSQNPYSSSDKTYSDCEASCSSDQNCVGFGYESSEGKCSLTEYNIIEATADPCETCSLSIKVCNGSIETTTQNAITELTSLTSVVTTVNEISTTPDVIPDVIQTTEKIITSNSELETSKSILSSLEDTTTYHQKTQWLFRTMNQDITSDDITTTTLRYKDTTSDINTKTTKNPSSDKYITSDIISTTLKSTAKATSPKFTISTVLNETKLPTTISASTALLFTNAVETTTNPDGTSTMLMYYTKTNFVNGSSTLCVCHCVFDNMTSLEVRLEERKNTLKMSQEDLSSFHRRLNCAYDPRNSSKIVGGVGILVLTLILSLIIIPDILTTASRLTRKRDNLVK